jgi:antitoxin (DNA-binding transcriptional repressor) of toxin-antitoxin stability system
MKLVGLRELKARLSFYIRQVRAGRHVLVTNRGEVVAELSPPGEAPATAGQAPAALVAMARRGLITLAPARQRAPDS